MEETIQPLDPIAFALGPIQVHWYGVIIGLAIVLGLYISHQGIRKRGLEKDLLYRYNTMGHSDCHFISSVYYVIFEWDYYSQNPGKSLRFGKADLRYMEPNWW